MTVYLLEGRRSRTERRKASDPSQSGMGLTLEFGVVPCSAIFMARVLPDGKEGKSRLITRGFSSSGMAKEPAVRPTH